MISFKNRFERYWYSIKIWKWM